MFVLSPDSVRSEVCAEELQRAVELHRRLIPVLRRDVEPEDVPSELRRPNWILLREQDDFDSGLARLIEGLETDLEWRDAHARLGVRAQEWDRSGRDRSFLLRGSDLRTAEQWLARQAEHREKATPEQVDYIVESRRSAARRQRITLGAVLAGLVVAIALAIVAVIQRQDAIRQSHTAQSRELAASSVAQLGVDPELSLLLALQAAKRSPTAQAEDALVRALQTSRVRLALPLKRGGDHVAAYSPDGKTIITGGPGRTAELWSATSGQRLGSLEGSPASRPGDVKDASFSPDGTRIVTVTYHPRGDLGTIRIWRARDRKLIGGRTDRAYGFMARFSPDGRDLLTAGYVGPPRIYGAQTPRPVIELGPAAVTTESAEFSPDGKTVVTTTHDLNAKDALRSDRVVFWDARRGRMLGTLPGSGSVGRVAVMSPDGRTLATVDHNELVTLWSVRSRRRIGVLRGHKGVPDHADFSPDGRLLVTAGEDTTARVWDVAKRRALLVLRGHTGPITSVTFSPDGRSVLTSSGDSSARVWDVTPAYAMVQSGRRVQHGVRAAVSRGGGLAAVARRDGLVDVWRGGTGQRVARLRAHRGGFTTLLFDPAGRSLLTASFPAKVGRLWDPASGRERTFLPNVDSTDGAAFSRDGRRLAVTTGNGGVEIWDVERRARVQTIPPPRGDAIQSAAFSPDGRQLATGQLEEIRLWDLRRGRVVAVNKGEKNGVDEVSSLRFSRDGGVLLAVVGEKVKVVDGRTLRSIRQLGSQGHEAAAPELSNDGRVVAVSSQDRTVRLQELSTGRTISALRGQPGEAITSVSFSPDDRFVATSGAARQVRVWDVSSGRVVGVVADERAPVFQAIFRPDGRSLVLAGALGPPVVSPCDLCASLDQLMQLAERRVTRGLTPAERARFLHEG